MRYSLTRHGDGAGDAGPMSNLIKWVEGEPHVEEGCARPQVGYCLQVGSLFARTMQWQDWWLTTEVTKIVSDHGDTVVFETKSGSTYTWKELP